MDLADPVPSLIVDTMDGGVITPPSPILCAVRIGMRVETCAAAAFSISQTGSKRGTASDDVKKKRNMIVRNN
eukprot:COSAG06_NODE_24572_length_658_cov_4.416816_2_plen_72_part_00